MLQPSEIEDRIRIHDLFVRYTTAVDNWDEAEVLACFTEDGVLETPVLGGRFEGREGQRRFVQTGRTRGQGVQTRHIFTTSEFGSTVTAPPHGPISWYIPPGTAKPT